MDGLMQHCIKCFPLTSDYDAQLTSSLHDPLGAEEDAVHVVHLHADGEVLHLLDLDILGPQPLGHLTAGLGQNHLNNSISISIIARFLLPV